MKTHLKADASAGSASATDSVGFSGYVVSVGDNLALGPAFNLYARGGYMSVDSDNHVKGSGGDGEVGAQYLVSAPLNLFVEYRYTALKFDSTKLDIGAIRAGMHFNFAS